MIAPGFELVTAMISSAVTMALVINVLFGPDEGREGAPRPLWRSCLEIAGALILVVGATACLLVWDPIGHLAGRSLELMAEVANGCGA